MTNEEINDQVGKIVEPDICRHKYRIHKSLLFKICVKCEGTIETLDFPKNFNYLSPDGIAKVRDWLEKQSCVTSLNKWHDFCRYVLDKSTAKTDRESAIYRTLDMTTKPELFMPKFIEYTKEKGLGE